MTTTLTQNTITIDPEKLRSYCPAYIHFRNGNAYRSFIFAFDKPNGPLIMWNGKSPAADCHIIGRRNETGSFTLFPHVESVNITIK